MCIHLCEQCAQPIVLQKQEAMKRVLSLFIKFIAEKVVEDLEKEGTKASVAVRAEATSRTAKRSKRIAPYSLLAIGYSLSAMLPSCEAKVEHYPPVAMKRR